MSPEATLYDAFVAGFAASGEGYNGEYVRPNLSDTDAFLRSMQEQYEKWVGQGKPLADRAEAPRAR